MNLITKFELIEKLLVKEWSIHCVLGLKISNHKGFKFTDIQDIDEPIIRLTQARYKTHWDYSNVTTDDLNWWYE